MPRPRWGATLLVRSGSRPQLPGASAGSRQRFAKADNITANPLQGLALPGRLKRAQQSLERYYSQAGHTDAASRSTRRPGGAVTALVTSTATPGDLPAFLLPPGAAAPDQQGRFSGARRQTRPRFSLLADALRFPPPPPEGA